jgi:hypothetical protein
MGVGTGFLVSAADLAPGESDAPLLVTCSYVISPEEGGGRFKAVPYSAAIVNFELAGVRRRVESVVWSSPADELRTIVVRLSESVPGVQPCPVMTTPYRVQEFDDPKVAIIGHPRGGSVAFSLRDPAVLAANETLIHYRSATEPGSSGSPVFDWNSWRVIAVHSAGSETMQRLDGTGTYAANEGISIRAIVNAVRARTGRDYPKIVMAILLTIHVLSFT